MKLFTHLFERSLLVRLGLILGLVVSLALASMLSAMIIAEMTKGEAAAINLVGSLRMQSHRTANLLLDHSVRDRAHQAGEIAAAIDKLEATLLSPGVSGAFPADPTDERRQAYEGILATWHKGMRPLFTAHLKLMTEGSAPPHILQLQTEAGTQLPQLLPSVNVFVARVNEFVTLLEQDIESKNLLLRSIQGGAILVTLVVIFFVIYLLQTEVVVPLRNLVTAAERIRSHDLTARVESSAPNELGALGVTFNQMAEELSRLYEGLGRRVAEKTASLERSNRSLELLYRSIALLYQKPAAADTYATLLKQFEEILGCGRGTACLAVDAPFMQEKLPNALKRLQGDDRLCGMADCAQCFSGGSPRWRTAPDRNGKILSLPLRDLEGFYGVLQWEIGIAEELEPWQVQLLEALATHVGIAVGAAQRVEQRRRWSLHEERTVMARELHDSLAQALSFMKIQVARLQNSLGEAPNTTSQAILAELQEGLNSAYRQLRELLSTFRLKVEGGLNKALEQTVAEFAGRGNIAVDFASTLEGHVLSPNEEIHLLQIVREALANVIHHAGATHAAVNLACRPDGMIIATIDDDGVGLRPGSTLPRAHHYGLTIMKERAANLQGVLTVERRPEGGTHVELQFMPGSGKIILMQREEGVA